MMTNMIVTNHVNVAGAPVTNTVANHAEKPKKINGQNFKRWQHIMFFYLTNLNLAMFLNEIAPHVESPKEGQPSNAQAVKAVKTWKHSDFLYNNYVLNGLVDSLYNVYCKTTTAKELWESLERKYKMEDAVKNGENEFGQLSNCYYQGKWDEIGRSSRIDDEVVQDKRQQDDNDLQDERQDQPKEEEVEPRRCKRVKTKKLFGPDFVSFNGRK
ncbi:hypothetical protein Tco_0546434 [Tanacetum coccineum]